MTIDRAAWVALYVAALTSLLVGLNMTVMNVVLPSIEQSFGGASRRTLGWGISGYSITIAALMLIGGRLADRRGRLLVFRCGLVVFALGSAMTAAAPGAAWFLAGRLVQAAGTSLLAPASLSMVLPLFPVERKATAISISAAIGYIGSGLAPGLSAGVVDRFGWRLIFASFAITAVGVTAVAPRFLPADRPAGAADRVDAFGAPAGAFGLGLAALAVIEGPRLGWSNGVIPAAAIMAVLFLGIFVRRSLHHPEPLVDLRMLRPRAVWSTMCANVLMSAAGTAVWVVYALFLVQRWRWPLPRVGVALMPIPISAGVAVLAANWVVRRIGATRVVLVGSFFPAAGLVLLLWRLTDEPHYFTGLLPGALLFNVGFGMVFAPLNAVTLTSVPEVRLSQANAVVNTVRQLGSGLAVAVVIALLGDARVIAATQFRQALVFLTVLSGALIVVTVGLVPRDRLHALRR